MSDPQTPAAGSADTAGRTEPAVFRAVPLTALVAVAFVALGASTIAFQGHWWFTLLLVPVALAWFVLATHTTVDTAGVRVQRPWGSRRLVWAQVSTLRLVDRGRVRLVGADGAETALPGIRVRDLGRVGEASGGRITVPTPADAEAAAEHERELAAARLRIQRLREREGSPSPDETAPDETAPDETAPDGTAPDGTAPDTAGSEHGTAGGEVGDGRAEVGEGPAVEVGEGPATVGEGPAGGVGERDRPVPGGA